MARVGLIYTGIRYLHLEPPDDVLLTEELSLVRPNQLLLSGRNRFSMNEQEYGQAETVSRFLLCRYDLLSSSVESEARAKAEAAFTSGLMAFQIVKPVETLGFVYRTSYTGGSGLYPVEVERRPPMEAGEWARSRRFDADLLPSVIETIPKVRGVLKGTNVALKNAIIFLQLGLESYHPLIAGLLWVTGMEAIFNSRDRHQFKDKLCNCLGPNTLVFPDWNALKGPPCVVKDVAIDLYMLRSKIAHGADLRTAAGDKSTPVDLLKKVTLHEFSQETNYSILLSQAACFLLCQVLQKTL
jgi:hypothetical protein